MSWDVPRLQVEVEVRCYIPSEEQSPQLFFFGVEIV